MPARPSLRPQSADSRRVVVIGGGLAGMAAAMALESAGLRVTLIEARPSLGGRAGSFIDPHSGQELDHGQHVLLGCCTNLIDFYRRLGTLHQIRWQRTIHFLDARSHGDLWSMPGLPAPFHLTAAVLLLRTLNAGERRSLIGAMAAMMRIGREGRRRLADIEFGQWLREHRQDEQLVRRFYDPALRGALNEDPARASARYALQVFQDAFLSSSDGFLLGLPRCPLSQLYRPFPCRDVRLGVRVGGLRFDETRVRAVELAGGELLPADAVVCAVGHHVLRGWVPAELAERDARFAGLGKLVSVPILNAHLWYDRPVLSRTHAALLEGPLQWVFRKDPSGRALHGVISAARQWTQIDSRRALDIFADQLRRLLPAAQHARLERGLVLVQKRATFSPLPGVDRWRPTQAPPADGIANLFLAGDYTRTEWPATMEGAVRSGYLAAERVLEALGRPPGRFLKPDLTRQWPARLLAALG